VTKYVVRWKHDNTFYAGKTRGGLIRWGSRDQAKELTYQQADAILHSPRWTRNDVEAVAAVPTP